MLKTFDYYRQVEDPDIYLCNPDRKAIAVIQATDRNLVLRFNDLSEFTCVVDESLNNSMSSANQTVYEKVCTKRLLFIEQIGWFQINSADEIDDGQRKYKSLSCQSVQVKLNNFGITTQERIYRLYNAEDPLDDLVDMNDVGAVPSVIGQLYQQLGINVNPSLSEYTPEVDYGQWTIIYVSPDLGNVFRTLKEETTYGYDFIKNTIADAYDVVFEFDFLHHSIKVKKITEITKKTNIYLSFDNIVNELNVTEESDDIVTVLSCNGSNIDITSVNPIGTNYLVNFDYYMKEVSVGDNKQYPWMSKELIDAINEWKATFESNKENYTKNVALLESYWKEKTQIAERIQFANLKWRDMQTAQDQYSTENSDGIIMAESVKAEENSLKKNTLFFNDTFVDTKIIRGYKSAPTRTRGDDGKYVFSFPTESDSKYGAISSMMDGYVPSENKSAGQPDSTVTASSAYLYYMDGDATSYCKIIVDSEVGVSKNSIGISSKVSADEDGFITLRNTKFRVRLNANAISVYSENGTTPINVDANGIFSYNGSRYQVKLMSNDYVYMYLFYASGFERYTSTEQIVGEDGWLTLWEGKCIALSSEDDSIQAKIDAVSEILQSIEGSTNIQKFIKAQDNSNKLYQEFMHYWIEGEFTNDNISVNDDTTMDETIEMAKQLMASGEIELARVSKPTLSISIDAINFTNLIEFKPFTEQLELGKVITVEKDEGVLYEPALVSLEMSLDDPSSFSLEFSNAMKLKDGIMEYTELVKTSSSTSRNVSANWSNLMSYHNNKKEIEELLNKPLDRTLRAAQKDMISQEFIVDDSGILGRKYTDDSHTGFLPQQVRIINNQLLFTDDAWNTCKLALGKIEYEEGKYAYGLAAEVLVGKLLLGESLKLTNSANTITLDNTGILISKRLEDETLEDVFKATTDGTLYVKGKIYATELELAGAVKIGTGNIDGLNDYAKKVGSYLKTADYQHTAGESYATKGMMIDLTNQFIRAENFCISESGAVYAKDLFNDVSAYDCEITNSISGITYSGCVVPMLRIGYDRIYDGWWITDGSDGLKNGDFTVEFDESTLIEKIGDSSVLSCTFVYNGSDWTFGDSVVALSEYGITIDSQTLASGDWFKIEYIATVRSNLLLYARLVRPSVESSNTKWEYAIYEGTYDELKNYISTYKKYPDSGLFSIG